MRKCHILILSVVGALLLNSCGADQAMKKGDKFYAVGEYFDAATQYRKAYTHTPSKQRVLKGQRAMKVADCYRRIHFTTKAITAYQNAIRYKQDDSLTHLYMGQLHMRNGSYKEAAKHFQMAIDSLSMVYHNSKESGNTGDSEQRSDKENAQFLNSIDNYISLAKTGLKAAQQAPDWKKEGSDYTIKRMDLFNSRRAEYSPMLSGDEDEQLYFTSTRNQAQGDEYSGITGAKNADIFLSQKDDKGKWSKPQTIDSELNSTMDEGACCFSPDGKSMYLTICKTDPNYPRYATIAVSNRSDASWSKPTELTLSKDTLSSFAHPAVSPDGQWLYFVSDMPGGLGGFDIWRCQIHGNEVGSLENLGEPVNTPGDEMFPTFRPNGDLYFSSDGHPGLGGLDIFIAKSKDKDLFTTTETTKATLSASGGGALASGEEKKLSKLSELSYKIEHPGFPLNSQGDDFGMTFEGKRNQGYFCSNRGDTRGYDHIYSFFNPEIVQTVKGWVYEQDGYELPAAQVYMVGNDGTNLKLSVRGDGSFTQEIKPNVDYVLLATCKGFLNHQEQLRVDPVTKSEEYVLQFPLANISAPVLIENIFYDFDKATLRPESTTALDELVRLLNENPNITIELSAHTDYKGSDEYNEGLSQRRAESVVNYLIEHGIPSDRLTPRGYGEGKPKTIKRKVAERYPFLKEGDVLTEEYINKLPEEQQEQCNQLNRRTEFIVLRTTYGLFDKAGKLIQIPQPKESSKESDEVPSSELW
jgi:outer membrane protein OmpA-like peptidoglycan-associated protein/tetratricopeptide (TPR) repeat protein